MVKKYTFKKRKITILGCVWVYGARQYVHFRDQDFEEHFCDKGIYWTAFATVTGYIVSYLIRKRKEKEYSDLRLSTYPHVNLFALCWVLQRITVRELGSLVKTDKHWLFLLFFLADERIIIK